MEKNRENREKAHSYSGLIFKAKYAILFYSVTNVTSKY